MGVVNEAVEDGVGICRITDESVPFVDGDLTGENGRATPIAFLEDLVEVTTGTGIERFEAPIVEDQELDAGETAQDAGVAAITAGEGEFGEEFGNPLIENRAVIAAGLVTQGTSKKICRRRSEQRHTAQCPTFEVRICYPFTRAAAKRSRWSVRRSMLTLNTLSSGNPIGHWRCCRRG
jgi:hypothetical protein